MSIVDSGLHLDQLHTALINRALVMRSPAEIKEIRHR